MNGIGLFRKVTSRWKVNDVCPYIISEWNS